MFLSRYKFLDLFLVGSLFSFGLCAQDNKAAFAAADTSGFSINSYGGWQVFNSYIAAYKTDSVNLEIILQHDNNIKWSDEQYVGRIKIKRLIPHSEQNLSYSLVVSTYNLRIDVEGNCYLRLASGVSPQQNPSVIPLKIIYKKE